MKNRALTLSFTMALACLASMGLTGCGGGKQAEKFSPSNIVSFGDESSAFTSEAVGSGTIKGLKYTVNNLVYAPKLANEPKLNPDLFSPTLPVDATINSKDYPQFPSVLGSTPSVNQPTTNFSTVSRVFTMDAIYTANGATTTTTQTGTAVTYKYIYNCGDTASSAANRIWIQILADSYGMSYSKDCLLDLRGRAETFATAGAKVADVVTQISANMSKISKNTLVTVLAGQNDILEKFDGLYTSGTPSETAINTAVNQLTALGRTLGSAINPIADKGARTLLVYVPDLSYSPKVATDAAKASVMKRLVIAFNDGLFSNGGARIDGTVIGLVNGYDVIRTMAQNPSSYGLTDGTTAACAATGRSIDTTTQPAITTAADLKYCNDATLVPATTTTPVVPAATAYNRLWAFDTWLSPAGHSQLAQAAFNRVDNDTF